MANTNAKRDENRGTVALGTTDDANLETRPLLVDPSTGRLLLSVFQLTSDPGGTLNTAKIDENYKEVDLAVGDDATADIIPLHICNSQGFLFVDLLIE